MVTRAQGSILEKVATSVATTVIWPRNGRELLTLVDGRDGVGQIQTLHNPRKKGELFAV